MRKITLLFLLIISLSVSAQFKFGAIAGVGVGCKDSVLPLKNFVTVGQLGPLVEYAGKGYSIRTGAVFQTDTRLMVPLQAIIRSTRRGGFVGLGVSMDVLRTNNTIGSADLIFGNKFARNFDFSACFSYPLKGQVQDATLSVRLCIFPLSTCKEACGF